MSAIYDNWERLVAAVLKKQQLWQLFHDHSRSPSILSEASSFGSTSRYSLDDLPSDLARIPKLVLVSDFSPAIDAECVHLASSEFLGRGTFGSAYATVMNNGAKIFVKRLEKSIRIPEAEFDSRMAIVGSIRQENVVALRAYYSTKDERLMLYDYYHRGSVYAVLHGETGQAQDYVSWETRLKIAIGAARGIAKIHSQNGATLFHGNIKASNIFFNSQEYGCVSDLGATVMDTKFAPAAYCYAPEVKKTKDVSQASDVYSFGILLLELLTRKPAVQVRGGPQAVDLVKLITSIRNKARAANVFDADLLQDPTVKDQVVKMLDIGIRCVVKSIKKRPKMSEVVKALEDIGELNRVISHARLTQKLVFFEDGNATFSYEDVLIRASPEILGKGMIGTCYKATLENGNTVVVKRLHDVVVAYDDFWHLLEAIGSLRHDNIAGIIAYFYSKDWQMLVYNYYYQGSVTTLLHGKKRGNDRTPLDLETRLKIILGAARGVACIHKKDGGKLVHGNIKSSNIFLDTQNHSIVSDAGLAKLVGHNSGVSNSGYCAPEVMEDTRRVSQASDVYSFGVVMLEILFRKQSKFIMDGGKVMLLVNWVQFIIRDEWTTDVFDVELLRDNREVETIVQVLQVAMDCIRFVPEHRPRMSQVMKMLEEISGAEPQNEISIESRLEDVLKDLLPTLTP